MRKPTLTIFYQFNPWHASIGGIQTVIRSFIKYAPDEFEVRLVGTANDSHLPTGTWQEAELAGRAIQFMPLIELQNDNFRRLVPSTVKYTMALLGRCFASDFMHFHRLEPSLASLHWAGEKTLFIHNDLQQQFDPKGKKSNLWQRFPVGYFALERLLVGQFNQILSCNTASMEFYQQRYPAIADRVTYLKNTVDNELFYPLTAGDREESRRIFARRMGLAEDTRFILFAGRLHAQKDPVLLVRSIAALRDLKRVHLLIAGDGDLRQEVQAEICRLELTNQVTMLGPVVQAELAQLQRLCSVLVLTSAYEGLPVTVLEALSCGTPVVTTRCGETPNLLCPGSGVVSRDSTPVAIADALRQVLLSPDDYPVAACVRAAEPYSARTVLGAIYNDMLCRWEQQMSSIHIDSTIAT